jgi:hypothetical protein
VVDQYRYISNSCNVFGKDPLGKRYAAELGFLEIMGCFRMGHEYFECLYDEKDLFEGAKQAEWDLLQYLISLGTCFGLDGS